MHRWMRRPSAATVMSATALFVSLGGVGYAATTIGSAQILNNSVRSQDIRNHTIDSKDIRKTALASLKGQAGATGPTGATGPRGPSDVYEAVQSNAFVAGTAGGTLGIELTGLPAGSYAIYGKASIVPITSLTPTSDAGTCLLTADDDPHQDRGIQTWDPGEGNFKTISTQLTHTFASTGSVTLRCRMLNENFRMGTGGPDDTRIIAVRVDNRTSTKVPID